MAGRLDPEERAGMENSQNTVKINGYSNGTQINGANGSLPHDNFGASEYEVQQKGLSNGDSSSVAVICGPLLNYKHLEDAGTSSIWNGSVLIVAKPGASVPFLNLNPLNKTSQVRRFEANKLYEDLEKTFWQFVIDLPLVETEAQWQYTIPNARNNGKKQTVFQFFVPAIGTSMKIMFHSCNGFSIGTDEDAWSGTALWNDVIRKHNEQPFHIMIGGGDQIYNDNVRVTGPLQEWTSMGNPIKRREFPFTDQLRSECDEHYYQNYVKWYALEPFSTANAQIPQLNIWDDHDIIDGFGSYTDHFMKCHVFRGIGGVAFKYYCLFQHHIAPPATTFTTNDPHREKPVGHHIFTAPQKLDSSFIEGVGVGPYIEDKSLSVYARLGRQVAFLGIDARMERTRHQINYPETYDKIFTRLESEVRKANGAIEHLILLLGVPIAYPRLIWLENILQSPIIGPIRFLNRRFGLAGGLFNKFDGQVDLLDDLDDHYTARQHKKERLHLILRLQEFSRAHSIRVTILGGDVHLGAVGRFYTPTKHKIKPANDHRFMVNIISSAITNAPPPQLVANMIGRRNKIHRLEHGTHETLMPLFDADPGGISKNAAKNNVTMPSRNYAIISYARTHHVNGALNDSTNSTDISQTNSSTEKRVKDGHSALHAGEFGAGIKFPTANGLGSGPLPGGLDVSLRVEIDNGDREGRTEGYGFSIPPLVLPDNKVSSST